MRHETLASTFASARAEGRGVLMPYLTGGFPEPEGFVDLALGIFEAGGGALEFGIPFSDPLLDGPTVQASQQAALDAGVTPEDCLRWAREIRDRSGKPILFMGAYNPLLAYGLSAFCRDAAAAGAEGLIVPDLPFEEQGELAAAAREEGLHLIQMVAPTSTDDRLRRACEASSGFVYCVSVAGVTGARAEISHTARPLVERVRGFTETPVAVGFGIASPEQAREVARYADGVIVGSALTARLAQSPPAERVECARDFIRSLHGALEGTVSA